MEVRFKGTKQTDPTAHDGFRVNYAAAKRLKFQWRWRFMLLVVVSPLLVWGWFLLQAQFLTRADGILTTEPIQVRASKSGFVTEVMVAPGHVVAAGQQLFDLSSPETDQKIQYWKEQVSLLTAYREQLIDELRSALGVYQQKLDDSRSKQDEIAQSYDQLADKGLFTLSDQMQLNEMRRALSQDERQQMIDLEHLESLKFTHDISDEIRNFELEILVAEVKQSQLDIRSDRSGVVNRLYAKQGEYVTEGDPLVELSNYTNPVVNVFLKPERLAKATEGREVVVILPNRTRIDGAVAEPPQIADTIPAALAGPFEGSRRAIKVVITLNELPETWVEGLPVTVRFK